MGREQKPRQTLAENLIHKDRSSLQRRAMVLLALRVLFFFERCLPQVSCLVVPLRGAESRREVQEESACSIEFIK